MERRGGRGKERRVGLRGSEGRGKEGGKGKERGGEGKREGDPP